MHDLDLNFYATAVHTANAKWWVCTKCNERGFKYFYAQLVAGETTPIQVSIVCPFCSGTKKANRNIGELLMLSVSELAEGMEGHRKSLKDDKLPQYDMLDVELVDCLIRVFDLLGSRGVDVEQIYQDKMAFNASREDHKLENRMKPGGKAY